MTFPADMTADQLVALSHWDRSTLRLALDAIPLEHPAGLEIGCYKGETSAWLCENTKLAELTVVDTFAGSPEHGGIAGLRSAFDERTRHLAAFITVRTGSSAQVLPALLCEGKAYDFIYVDGSHDSRDVLLDAVLAWRLLAPGGVIVFDDYLWEMNKVPERNPRPAIDAFWRIHQPELAVIANGYKVAFRKL